jgi:uncharacterized protein
MKLLPIRLRPDDDLRRSLEEAVAANGCAAAFVLCGIGSLARSKVRFAGASEATASDEDLEILSLAGTISKDGSHLHAALARTDGTVLGGHVAYGCTVRTTAEVLLALLPDWEFSRVPDPATGFAELLASKRSGD